jgi:hypothetical protein
MGLWTARFRASLAGGVFFQTSEDPVQSPLTSAGAMHSPLPALPGPAKRKLSAMTKP